MQPFSYSLGLKPHSPLLSQNLKSNQKCPEHFCANLLSASTSHGEQDELPAASISLLRCSVSWALLLCCSHPRESTSPYLQISDPWCNYWSVVLYTTASSFKTHLLKSVLVKSSLPGKEMNLISPICL